MESKNTIELNGVRYDAVSGKVLGSGTGTSQRATQNIDGFFRGRAAIPASGGVTALTPSMRAAKSAKPHRSPNHARAHAPQASQTVGIRVRSDVQHSQKLTVHRSPSNANHTKAHTTQNSRTLMRAAVKPPLPSFHRQARTKAALQHAVPSLIVPKKSISSLDDNRLERAKSTPRSPLITRHGGVAKTYFQPLVQPLAVQTAPDAKPQEQVPPTTPPPIPTNKPTDIFEHALANATNFVDLQTHKVHFKKQTRRHIASLAAGTLALVFIAGFAVYQNTPGLQFKVASIRAGVATSMPDFKSAGFAYGGVKAGDGKLFIGFKSGQGSCQLTQQPTNLSGTDMIADIGGTDASGTPTYQTVQVDHTDVYRFNGTDAAWIADGQWYTVTGNKALTDAQVAALVQHV